MVVLLLTKHSFDIHNKPCKGRITDAIFLEEEMEIQKNKASHERSHSPGSRWEPLHTDLLDCKACFPFQHTHGCHVSSRGCREGRKILSTIRRHLSCLLFSGSLLRLCGPGWGLCCAAHLLLPHPGCQLRLPPSQKGIGETTSSSLLHPPPAFEVSLFFDGTSHTSNPRLLPWSSWNPGLPSWLSADIR